MFSEMQRTLALLDVTTSLFIFFLVESKYLLLGLVTGIQSSYKIGIISSSYYSSHFILVMWYQSRHPLFHSMDDW